jgi:hypothetical protein
MKATLLSLASFSFSLTSGIIGGSSQAIAQTATDTSGNNYYLGSVEILGNGTIRINYSEQLPCRSVSVMGGGTGPCIPYQPVPRSMLARCYDRSYSTNGQNWYRAASGSVFRVLIDRACS